MRECLSTLLIGIASAGQYAAVQAVEAPPTCSAFSRFAGRWCRRRSNVRSPPSSRRSLTRSLVACAAGAVGRSVQPEPRAVDVHKEDCRRMGQSRLPPRRPCAAARPAWRTKTGCANYARLRGSSLNPHSYSGCLGQSRRPQPRPRCMGRGLTAAVAQRPL
jgi:hypothetical protein